MTVTLTFLALLMAGFVAWLFSHSVNVRPWVAGSSETARRTQVPEWVTAPRMGLMVLLATVTSVFTLIISAYLMRMEMGADWHPLPDSALLWFNSALLVLASVALHGAWRAARQDAVERVRHLLIAGGGLSALFVVGQLLVWRQLAVEGYYLATNPANAFYYLLTSLHGLHLLGGLVAWAKVFRRLQRGGEPARLRSGIELCAVYWDFLLLVWVVVFALLLKT
ncbi:cytochrome oxidase subunit III [Halomonas urumqiensis]|uniref:Cytochrome oxidase subunit III n=1 Tax=Halomonas urumqiensis TaxID=1684789 RepID=A0A2N7UDG0_9GAMM|nr:cytochrome oxidase subunit III [Halomonas urumqiensis]PMR78484.1 cytochrome oxidase subunit III [Halomonas urumqiensis]PTB03629.1 cytochrome oxidase subunit III [Halomonas urumqiensis]GHE20160.1 cytochrome-c oxidase [Halomonas urumqiensis]